MPFWTTRTPGWDDAETAAATFLHCAWSRALAEGRYEDASAIRAEMTTIGGVDL
jgi:hypothetical protein